MAIVHVLQSFFKGQQLVFNQTDVLDTIDQEEEVDSTDSHVCDALEAALTFTCQTGRRLHL